MPSRASQQPAYDSPSAAALQLLCCPECRSPLDRLAGSLRCNACETAYPVVDGVVRFLQRTDSFYEGAYARQIHHLPGRSALRDFVFFRLVQSGVLGDVRRVLPPRGALLDLGCAGGIRWLGRDALSIGIDLSIASLEIAATTYAAALQASVLHLPCADQTFDVVYGSYVFEHLSRPDKRGCLKEARRVLKAGGAVVLQFDTLSNNEISRYAQRDPAAFQRAFIDHDGHIGLAPLSDSVALIESSGLHVEQATKLGTTWLQYLPTYRWLDAAYGERRRWVHLLGSLARGVAASRLALPYEFAVTAFDRLVSPLADGDRATRAIVVARKPK